MARQTLDRQRIVHVAIELLDEEGLEGLSMRRLGERLGSAATAVYWHVQSKENLIALAGDEVWSKVALADPHKIGWRAAAVEVARRTYDLGVTHHWLMPAMSSFLAYGTGLARQQDHSYAIFEAAGFSGPDLDRAVNTLFTFVLGATYQDSAQRALQLRAAREGADKQLQLEAAAAHARDVVAQFPRLSDRANAQASVDPIAARNQALQFGLDSILDGLEARLARQS